MIVAQVIPTPVIYDILGNGQGYQAVDEAPQ